MKDKKMKAEEKAVFYFKKARGLIRTSQAIEQGIRPEVLYKLRDRGVLESLGRGFFKLADQPVGADPQLIQLGMRHKNAVLCLISALFIHKLTTQIPRQVYIALPKGSHPPKSAKGRAHFFILSPEHFKLGIQEIEIDGLKLKVYDPEKTIVDCFKFRNKIGMDLAIEALKEWKKGRSRRLSRLLAYAKACRVEKVMAPYLEAMT
jgi:predicted transcriptional regulator of viral defense system